MKKILCFDFDSTVVTKESLDEVLTLALETHPDKDNLVKSVEGITNQGMNGAIDFCESLKLRLETCPVYKHHFEQVGANLCEEVTTGFETLFSWLRSEDWEIFVVSGGFRLSILPVAAKLGVPATHVFAQEAFFDDSGLCIGIDEENILFTDEGKGPVVEYIRSTTSGADACEIVLVGDGSNDLKAYELGKVDHFIGFGGNVVREKVRQESPNFALSAIELKDFITQI